MDRILNKNVINKYIMIYLFLTILFLLGYLSKYQENFTDSAENIFTKLKNTTLDKINDIFLNITNTQIVTDKKITIDTLNAKNLKTDNIKLNNSNLCIGKTCLSETDLLKYASMKQIAGYAIDGKGSTYLLRAGFHNLNYSNESGYNHKKYDIIQIFKGWEIKIWGAGKIMEKINVTKDSMKWRLKSNKLENKVTQYSALWVGY